MHSFLLGMSDYTLNVRFPAIGEYGEGSVPQACYDALCQVTADPPTAVMLGQLVRKFGMEGVAFVTNGEDGVTVLDDRTHGQEIVFAVGKDFLFPPDELAASLQEIIMRYYADEHVNTVCSGDGNAHVQDDAAVVQALLEKATV
jgi:hypothetical protein